MTHHTGSNEGRAEVTVAIKAQNPDLETAWRTIAWWEQTCNYWREQATARAAAPDALCSGCDHAKHGDHDCGEVIGYDHLNGDHDCGCPGEVAEGHE